MIIEIKNWVGNVGGCTRCARGTRDRKFTPPWGWRRGLSSLGQTSARSWPASDQPSTCRDEKGSSIFSGSKSFFKQFQWKYKQNSSTWSQVVPKDNFSTGLCDKKIVLVIFDVLVKSFELSDLEGQDADERHHHQEERVDSSLHQDLHLRDDSCTADHINSFIFWNIPTPVSPTLLVMKL